MVSYLSSFADDDVPYELAVLTQVIGSESVMAGVMDKIKIIVVAA